MAETSLIARPSPGLSLDGDPKPATVSASALALHLDCSRTYIGKLEAEGVIQRQGDGFPLDQSRVAYLRYLRRERRRSPRAEADVDHVKVKTEMLRLRLLRRHLDQLDVRAEGEGGRDPTNDLFAFLTIEPNLEVGAIHPKAMPVIQTTPAEVET